MILVGIPNLHTMLSKNILATSAAVTEIEQGTRTTLCVNLECQLKSLVIGILDFSLIFGKVLCLFFNVS